MTVPILVIIPIWHGNPVIDRSLTSIAEQNGNVNGIRIIAAINDGEHQSVVLAENYRQTLEARGFQYDVITTPPGRNCTFAAAEAQCEAAITLYVDQDAKLSPGALATLSSLGTKLAEPLFITFSLRFSRSPSLLVRMFTNGWLSLPYVVESPVVAGVYGVTSSGRKRWQTTPAGLPDDKFARMQFGLTERMLIRSESYEVFAPQTYKELVRNRARYRKSNLRIKNYFKCEAVEDARRYAGFSRLFLKPHFLLAIAVTCLFAFASSFRVEKCK
jgi:hypothetical protein